LTRPTPATAKDAALEYHLNHRLAVDFAPKPPIERWRADQRERFENGSRWLVLG
jgi:hypothetical protein